MKYFEKHPSTIFPLVVAAMLFIFVIVYQFFDLPSPQKLVQLAEALFEEYGTIVILVGSFLETLFMISLYLPGSFVIFLAVFFSDRTIFDVFEISFWSSIGMFAAISLNYCIGKYGLVHIFRLLGGDIAINNMRSVFSRRGLFFATFLSGLHPNFLAIAFVYHGISETKITKALLIGAFTIVFWVPLMIFVASIIADELNRNAESAHFIIISVFLIWAVIGHIYDRRKLGKSM